MIKSIIAFVGASALAVVPGVASAQSVSADHNPITLEGYATLGDNLCYLTLTATLGDNDGNGNYGSVTNLTGTNDIDESDFDCRYISVVGGSGTVVTGGIELDSLEILVGLGPVCEAALTNPVSVAVTNSTASTVNAQVNQNTDCGYITADLDSDSTVQIN